MSVTKKAKKASRQLVLVSWATLVLSTIGGVLLMVLAFAIFSEDNFAGLILMFLAVAQTLFVWLLYAFAKAVAAGLDLRVGQFALASDKDANPKGEIAVNPGARIKLPRSDASKTKYLTEEELADWILQGQPSLSGWDPTTSFDLWLRGNSPSQN